MKCSNFLRSVLSWELHWASPDFAQYVLLDLKILPPFLWKGPNRSTSSGPTGETVNIIKLIAVQHRGGWAEGKRLVPPFSPQRCHPGCSLKSELLLFLSHLSCHFRCTISLHLRKAGRRTCQHWVTALLLFSFCCLMESFCTVHLSKASKCWLRFLLLFFQICKLKSKSGGFFTRVNP